jgi:hypothetical protein
MSVYETHLDEYISKAYWTCSHIEENKWGDRDAATAYMNKYWLSDTEYESIWQPIERTIFHQRKTLPEMVFRDNFDIIACVGGVLMEESDVPNFRSCMNLTGDHEWVVVENLFERQQSHHWPPFRMKYPRSITWEELMSGNYISSVLFEWPGREYFIFGNSGVWGMYAASDYIHPLNIIGYRPEYASSFKTAFALSDEERLEIADWIPPVYRQRGSEFDVL